MHLLSTLCLCPLHSPQSQTCLHTLTFHNLYCITDVCGIFDSDVLQLQSNLPDVLVLCGLVLSLCGWLPQVLQHAQSVLQFDPGHKPAQCLCKHMKEVKWLKEEGNQVFKLGKLDEALKLYTDVLEVCFAL